MKNVTIIQRVLPHYRITFFDRLHESLASHGIHLQIIYGQEYPGTVPKTVEYNRPWAKKIKNRYINMGSMSLVWQPCLEYLGGSRLIVIEQANSLLVDYLLLFRVMARRAKVAFWGHGRNFQAVMAHHPISELLKKFMANKCDWWFAYNGRSAEILRSIGFPQRKTTIINNTIDTDEIDAAARVVSSDNLMRIRKELSITTDNISVYCGGMNKNKKLEFLIKACVLIKDSIDDFHMIFIGEGPDEQLIAETCRKYPWMHYVGAKYGKDKIAFMKLARNILMPGAVGLIIIDSFALGLPLFTTDISLHGPEIHYLANGANGVMTECDIRKYADSVIGFFARPEMQVKLVQGCQDSADRYNLNCMVNNFADGIKKVLMT